VARTLEPTAVKTLSLSRQLSLYYFFQKAGFAYLTVLFMAMFLRDFGAEGLPWYYVGQTTVFIVSQILIMRFTRWRGKEILSGLLITLGGFVLLLTAGAKALPGWLIFLAMMIFKASEVHANQSFFDVSGQLLSVRESKQKLPGIMAAGTVGAVLAGFSLRFHHNDSTLALFLAMTAVIFLVARYLLPITANEEANIKLNTEKTPIKSIELKDCAPKTRYYVILVLVLSAAGTFTCSLIDFLFSGRVAIEWHDAAKIATFLGFFGAITDLVILTTQGLLGGKIFRNLPLGKILAIRPLALSLIALLTWWQPLFWLVVMSQFLMRATTFVFMSPSFVLLFEPLPSATKIYARRLQNIIDAVTTLTIGIGLIMWTRFGGGADPGLYLFDAILFAATMLLTSKLVSLYPEMIQETLAAAPADEKAAVIAGVRFLPEKQRISHIHNLLSSNNPAIREMAIKECARKLTEDSLDLLITFINREDHGPNLTLIVRAITAEYGSESRPLLAEFLSVDQEPRLIADLLEAIGHADFPELEMHSVRFLDFPHHRVRGAAMLNLLHHAHNPENLHKVVDRLYTDISSADAVTRATMAVVMGRAGLKAFLPALLKLADDPDEKTSLKAIRALSGFAVPKVKDFLLKKSEIAGKIGEAARNAAAEVSDAEFCAISRLLHGLPDEERTRISFWRQVLGTRIDRNHMRQLLNLPQPEKREAILRALAESEADLLSVVQLCILSQGESTTIVTQPLWQAIANSDWQQIPAAAALIPALCNIEDKIGKTLLYDRTMLIGQAIAILQATKNAAHQAEKAWKQRFEILLQILSLWGQDPAAWHDIIQKARSSDKFITSVAEEFLETRLGKDFAAILLPLLNPNQQNFDLIKLFQFNFDITGSSTELLFKELDRLETEFLKRGST